MMKNNNEKSVSRRKFIGTSIPFIAGIGLMGPSVFAKPSLLENYKKPDSNINGVQVGVITYSFRSMPDQSAEATLKYIVDSGISAIELMGGPAETFAGKPEPPIDEMRFRRLGWKSDRTDAEEKQYRDWKTQMDGYSKKVADWRAHVPMDKFKALRKMYKEAGVSIYAFKPNAFGKDNTDAEINWGMRAAKALGANQVTVEHPGDDAWTQKLGDMAAKHKIYVSYHGHLQQTPTLWDTALKQSKWNGINLDLGHFVAAGNTEPLQFIKDKHDRILSMHVKDRQSLEHGQKNLPWGEGDTPITQALQLMRDKNYDFPASVELEYDIPNGSDAVKEVSKCLNYCREALT